MISASLGFLLNMSRSPFLLILRSGIPAMTHLVTAKYTTEAATAASAHGAHAGYSSAGTFDVGGAVEVAATQDSSVAQVVFPFRSVDEGSVFEIWIMPLGHPFPAPRCGALKVVVWASQFAPSPWYDMIYSLAG